MPIAQRHWRHRLGGSLWCRLSGDIEFASAADIEALAAAGTMANTPRRLAPDRLRHSTARRPPGAAGVPFIVSTDLNPGSSYLYDLITAASLAISPSGSPWTKRLRRLRPIRLVRSASANSAAKRVARRPWWLLPERSRPVSAAARAARASVCRRQRDHSPPRGGVSTVTAPITTVASCGSAAMASSSR